MRGETDGFTNVYFKEISLPTPFKGGEKIKIQAYYSLNKKQLFLLFNKSEIESFSFFSGMGNPIPGGAFNFDVDESTVGAFTLQSLSIQNSMMLIPIDYAFAITQVGFFHRFNNVRGFTVDFLNAHLDSYRYEQQHKNDSYTNYLNNLKYQMAGLFFHKRVPELSIDKFIEENPIILQRGLQLENLNHQVVLKNLLDKYEHDLKPDLIAFDTCNKNWVVVDYKRAKRSIIKNLGKVRSGFKSDVHDLQNQLLDYIGYFEEKEQREYVEKHYKINILLPNAIGIIGKVSIEEQDEFNRQVRYIPQWYKVVPYNYLYDNFCRYVDSVKEISGNQRE